MPKIRHITSPSGFVAAGVACGIKSSGKKDLGIFAASGDAAAAIITTDNQVVGAPVVWCRKLLPRGYGKVRGVVINSGNANVWAGTSGQKDAETMATETARHLGTAPEKILVASTGIIGQPLPMAKVRRGIAAAAAKLSTGNDSAALRAIMTTDTREKYAVLRTTLGGKKITLAGIVKGSGMIAPSLATMIALITTDAAVSPAALHKALISAGRVSFNTITVDSDTSPSDTVVVLASGAAGNKTITSGSSAFKKFSAALEKLCCQLARAVVADGEGATKVIEIEVCGARSAAEAQIAAKAVANSPLLKCAIHGGDPNWGRVVVALGKSAAKIIPARLSVSIAGVTVFARGAAGKFNAEKLAKRLSGESVKIICDLGLGRGSYTALSCDLSRRYVTINARYHT